MKIEPQRARNKTDKILLNNVDQYRTDYCYWLKSYNTKYYSEFHKEWLGVYISQQNDIFDKAWEFVNILGDKEYYSIEIVVGDSNYDLNELNETIITKVKQSIPINSKVYIATNLNDVSFIDNLKENYDVWVYSDVVNKIQYENIDSNWIQYINQLICSRSNKFIGNEASIFSSYVYRLRTYMSDIKIL